VVTEANGNEWQVDIRPFVPRQIERHWDRNRKVRLLGVGLSSFTLGGEQLDLLEPERREKMEKLAPATDRLRDRFGFSKVQFGGSLERRKKEVDS
jgi:hypothetical protein